MTEVNPNFKPEPITCAETGCGLAKCKAAGQPTKTGHPRLCVCPRCIGKRNKRKGQSKQARATTMLGIPKSSISPGHEEFLGGQVRVEVKAGAQVKPMVTAYLRMEAQSEEARPFGDNRPFVGVAMPDGSADGIVAFRLSKIDDVLVALAEMRGLVA
jgi:hypothetical protein